jgi:hypothetical protein
MRSKPGLVLVSLVPNVFDSLEDGLTVTLRSKGPLTDASLARRRCRYSRRANRCII